MTKSIPQKPATRAEQLAVTWLEECEGAGRQARYLQHSALTLRHWLAYCVYFKSDPLRTSTPVIQKFVERRHASTGRKASHAERRRQRAVLRAWYRWLYVNGYAQTDYAAEVAADPKARPQSRVARKFRDGK